MGKRWALAVRRGADAVTPQEYEEAGRLFAEVCDLRPDVRAARLEDACRGRPDLRTLVERLLQNDEEIARNEGRQRGKSDPSGLSAIAPACPDWIGPYRILEPIGEGGMGIVYLAEQREPLRRRVALKVIKPGMDTREVLARFESERQTLAILEHPGIARIFDAGNTEDGRPYFVMEYVKGLTLLSYSDEHKLSVVERLRLFQKVCQAVNHAHRKGIVHRDLKPSNILVVTPDQEPEPKIIDFGIARAVEPALSDKTVHTQLGKAIGTLPYMSPEQAALTPEGVDGRADVYSLGVVLYELLVGELPHEWDSLRKAALEEVLRTIREEDPPLPSTRWTRLNDETTARLAKARQTQSSVLSRELRGDLDCITMKALEKEKRRRYQTALELDADIERYLGGFPVAARPPSVLYRAGKFGRKHRSAVVSAAVTGAVVAVLLLVALFLANREVRRTRARALIAEARDCLKQYRDSAERYLELDGELLDYREERRPGCETWLPVWERSAEIQVHRQLQALKNDLDRDYGRAVALANQAMEVAPSAQIHAEALGTLEDVYVDRYREADTRKVPLLDAAFFKTMVQSLKAEDRKDAHALGGSVSLESDPPGATVFCFRFEPHEERLLPIPFNPQTRLSTGAPFLRVEWVKTDTQLVPFLPGDRLLSLSPSGLTGSWQEVPTRSDLARILSAVKQDQETEVRVLRNGTESTVRWVPFPTAKRDDNPKSPLKPGRLVSIRDQLDLDFAGYPVDLTQPCGATTAGRPIRLELPQGSYLFVLVLKGYAEARVPMTVPMEQGWKDRVRLLPEEMVPPGFVYVPTGDFFHGGDPMAFEPLDRGITRLPGFLIARYEVTIGEYDEFLSDPDTLKDVEWLEGKKDQYAVLKPRCRSVRDAMARFGEVSSIRITPKNLANYAKVKDYFWMLISGEPKAWKHHP